MAEHLYDYCPNRNNTSAGDCIWCSVQAKREAIKDAQGRDHIKSLALGMVQRLSSPFDYLDMNDDSVDWQEVHNAMRRALAEENHMGSVLIAAMIAISGHDPY